MSIRNSGSDGWHVEEVRADYFHSLRDGYLINIINDNKRNFYFDMLDL